MNSTRSNIRGLKVPVILTEIFGEETMLAARLCKKHGVPFVTIDSPHILGGDKFGDSPWTGYFPP